jgi:BirA family biotin operon repressor/biotin-[acetyl-CoA-carboxylase] ligase
VDQATLSEKLAGLSLGPIRFLTSVDSTNNLAAQWASEGAPNLSLVVSDEQTAGRGRLGRRWYTPPGTALAFSLIIQDTKQEAFTPKGMLSRWTALGTLAVCEALKQGYPKQLHPQIKWPNDVLVANRKLAGVLCEAYWQGDKLQSIILGIGLNITPESVPDADLLDFPATCLEAEVNEKVERWDLLHAVLDKLLYWKDLLPSPAFIQAWENSLAYRGDWVLVIYENGSSLEGQITGLQSDGALVLHTRSGSRVQLQAGEIHLRPLEDPS